MGLKGTREDGSSAIVCVLMGEGLPFLVSKDGDESVTGVKVRHWAIGCG